MEILIKIVTIAINVTLTSEYSPIGMIHDNISAELVVEKTSEAPSKNLSLVSKVPITKHFLCQRYCVRNSVIIKKTREYCTLASST